MGSCCCHTESPCSSAEERSVLLKGDAKATICTGKPTVLGACGPQHGGDGLRIAPEESQVVAKVEAEAVQVKKCVETEAPTNTITQENGPLKEPDVQTVAPTPRRGSELLENSTTAQDEEVAVIPEADIQTGPLQCTLSSPQKKQVADDQPGVNTAPVVVNSASAQDERLDINPSAPVEAAGLGNHTGMEAAATADQSPPATQSVDQETDSKIDFAVAEEPLNCCETNAVSSVSCQLQVASLVIEEMESLSRAATHSLENGSSSVCDEPVCEAMASPDICESSPGSDPTATDRSGEEHGSAPCAGEPTTTASGDASERTKRDEDARPEPPCVTAVSEEVVARPEPPCVTAVSEEVVASLANTTADTEDEPAPGGREGNKESTAEVDQKEEEEQEELVEVPGTPTGNGTDAESPVVSGKEEQPEGTSPTSVAEEEIFTASEGKVQAEGSLGNSEEDLYRGAEELSAGPPPQTSTLPQDRCSLDPAMDVLSYSEREWRGNTAKSALIRKGYKELSQRFGSLRRVRGDNYCALRATLFQVLSHSTPPPSWLQEDDFATLPKQLEAQEGLISQWTFPGECLGAEGAEGAADATLKLQGYVEQLWTKWRAAAGCPTATERQRLCERAFRGGEEELGLLEALKLLMLGRAVQLHGRMRAGADVPLFCWLLFARDSSECPRSFLCNHLGRVGLGAGLEQVEMFLLGYALQCTIQVYRLYKADTEEFVTYYPDDHKDEWPCVCLVTEDDRHYNVPVLEAASDGQVESS